MTKNSSTSVIVEILINFSHGLLTTDIINNYLSTVRLDLFMVDYFAAPHLRHLSHSNLYLMLSSSIQLLYMPTLSFSLHVVYCPYLLVIKFNEAFT